MGPSPICSFCKPFVLSQNALLVVNDASFTVKVTWGGGRATFDDKFVYVNILLMSVFVEEWNEV